MNKLLLIASFVFDFLCIHPFTDGNGRISRLITVLLLHKAGYEVGCYISLERIIWEYFLSTLLRAYEELEERINSIVTRKGIKTNLERLA